MKKHIKNIVISLLISALGFVLSYNNLFSDLDSTLTDKMYSKLRKTNQDVIIICIDSETLSEYGAFSVWSRDKVADVINYLYEEKDNEPYAVGIDILFQGNTDEDIDNKLVEACKDRSVINSSIIKIKPTVSNDTHEYDKYNIAMVETSFDSLYNVSDSGFANTNISNDSVIRYSTYEYIYNGEVINSLSYKLASIYSEKKGIELPKINCNQENQFRFFYSGSQNDFNHISLKTVLEGKVPNSEFKDKIVLIGAFASAMQDEFYPTSDITGTMYGVAIHANIFQALVDGKTAIEVNKFIYSLVFSIIVFVVCMITQYSNFIVNIVLPLLMMIVHLLLGKVLSDKGIIIHQVSSIIIFLLLIVSSIVRRFIIEYSRRKHITQVFNRYMDPKLVNRLAKDDSKEINLNGEKRNVAVLFVDIRGFTTMSESMDPADVVGILNEYLGHVTDCIFKHNGMLDKFIGDAAMAVYNAPLDQEDYIYEAVATAYDIAQGSKEISEKLLQKYGKTVSYGVGVHIGEAVIGNIGCKTRMDYTAIGDTVNTASRIEGKAGKGEILISVDVKNELNDRIIVEDAGKIELKGKAEPVSVYRLIGLK